MILSLGLFIIGLLGFILNRKNLILMLINLELMLLSVTLLFVLSSLHLDEFTGQYFSILILCVAGAETALGLGLVLCYYRIRGNVLIINE